MKETNQEQKQHEGILFTVHFPRSGNRVPLLRVMELNPTTHYVVKVLDIKKKQGKVFADAEFGTGLWGAYFTTKPNDWGHMDLCHHLWKHGVSGRYKTWYNAVMEGNKVLAEEREHQAEIRFSLRFADDKLSDWTITIEGDEAEDHEDVADEEGLPF